MRPAHAARAQLRAIQDRVRDYRFRDSERYIADLDELRRDLRRLDRMLVDLGAPTIRVSAGAALMDVPVKVISGKREVIVCRVGAPRQQVAAND